MVFRLTLLLLCAGLFLAVRNSVIKQDAPVQAPAPAQAKGAVSNAELYAASKREAKKQYPDAFREGTALRNEVQSYMQYLEWAGEVPSTDPNRPMQIISHVAKHLANGGESYVTMMEGILMVAPRGANSPPMLHPKSKGHPGPFLTSEQIDARQKDYDMLQDTEVHAVPEVTPGPPPKRYRFQ